MYIHEECEQGILEMEDEKLVPLPIEECTEIKTVFTDYSDKL